MMPTCLSPSKLCPKPKIWEFQIFILTTFVPTVHNQSNQTDDFFKPSFCLHMGKQFQKSALPTLFHSVGVSAAHQPHVNARELQTGQMHNLPIS